MKAIFIFFGLFINTFGFAQNSGNHPKQNVPDSCLTSLHFITLLQAEKILEQPVHLKDSTWFFEGGEWKFKCKYLSNSMEDSVKIITAELFFAFEQYKTVADATAFMQNIKNANEKTSTINNLDQTGDEAFMMKDALNNPFILIRKNNKIYKLKTYNHHSNASNEELKKIAQLVVPIP